MTCFFVSHSYICLVVLNINVYMREKYSKKTQWKTYKNEDIKAFNILVIDTDGNKVWPIPRAKALAMAYDKWLDLVQVWYNPKEKVSTAKIVDFGKWMYEKKKMESEKKKKQKQKWQKEVKFWYNIGDHDLDLKLKKAAEFLQDGYIVKLMVVLKWREKAYKELVREKMIYAEWFLDEYGKSQGIKIEQFWFTLVLLNKKS